MIISVNAQKAYDKIPHQLESNFFLILSKPVIEDSIFKRIKGTYTNTETLVLSPSAQE